MDPRFSDATGSCQFRTSASGLGFLLFLHMHRQAPGKGRGVELTGAYVVSYYNLLCMVNYDCFDSDILLQFTTLPCNCVGSCPAFAGLWGSATSVCCRHMAVIGPPQLKLSNDIAR